MPRDPKQIMKGKPEKVKGNLHKFISQGGKPKNFEGSQGVNQSTVPGAHKCSCKSYKGCVCGASK